MPISRNRPKPSPGTKAAKLAAKRRTFRRLLHQARIALIRGDIDRDTYSTAKLFAYNDLQRG